MNAIHIYICPVCHAEHSTEQVAKDCCPAPEVFRCSKCGQDFLNERAAEECCTTNQ